MKKIILLAVPALISGLFFCCSSQVRQDSITDYTSTGFVTDSCFQVIVKAQPDSNARTLAEKRESSLKLAGEQVLPEAQRQLKAYILSTPITNQDSFMHRIEKDVENYISKGYIVCNYNLEDAASVIVYRIYSPNLKTDIDKLILELKQSDGTVK